MADLPPKLSCHADECEILRTDVEAPQRCGEFAPEPVEGHVLNTNCANRGRIGSSTLGCGDLEAGMAPVASMQNAPVGLRNEKPPISRGLA